MNLAFLSKTRTLFLSLVLVAASAFTTSCGDGDSGVNLKIPGVVGPTVTLQQDNVLISMVFENIQLDGGLRYAIPKYNNSYMELSPDLQSSGTLFSISVSLKDVFDSNLQLLDPQSLPGGRALPGVATGKLPAVAFSIPKFHNITFYLGPKFFGLFMPVNLDIDQAIVTARFYSGKIRAGNLSIVGKDANGENAGFLLLLDLSSNVQKSLKKVMNQYN
ncbi:MAG: hypothetical protein Fur0010_07530 [Bdellovibrio sp.]